MTGRALSRRRRRATAAAACAAVGLAAGLGACAGGRDDQHRDGEPIAGDTLVIYSSLPLRANERERAADVLRGERLALSEAHGRVGRFRIRLISLDSADVPGEPKSDPPTVAKGAGRAARDPRTIAYIGDLDSAATAVALPLLNEAGILQVSPTAGATELTKRSEYVPGSPQKYYPKLHELGRTFARVAPADGVQARALMRCMARAGERRLAIVDDRSMDGQSIANALREPAHDARIRIVLNANVDPLRADASDMRKLATKIVDSGAGALFYGGHAGPRVALLWRYVHALAPQIQLLGPEELADPRFTRRLGAAGASACLTSPQLPRSAYPPAGRRFFAAFRRRYGREPLAGAIFGYVAMRAVLSAISRAGARGNSRSAVVRELMATHRTRSPVGPYAILPRGDTTLSSYGIYRVVGGRPIPRTAISAPDG